MEGPKTIRNISQKDSANLNIKFETDCAADSGEVSAQYVCERRSSILTALSDRRAPAQNLLDNNGVIFNQSKENYTGDNETSNSFSENLFNNGLGNKTNKIKQIIESAISPESKQTVSKILDQVNQLSIAEKLLLYLKLPTGRSQTTDPLRQPLNPLGSRFEIHQTITWIKTHLEEDQDISLPKQDVYDEYIAYCDSIEMKPLSTADFGKVMKQVFPRVRPRRLGTRGNSRYCYAGMRKRVHLDVPLLPDLAEACDDHCGEDETISAASCLIREWAEKLLSVKFDNLQDLACHLVGNLCVDSRSIAAFTLMSALEPRKFFSEKDVIPLLLPSGGQANKHRETQLQLQRKLQEREVIREQKRKMQDQQPSGHRTHSADKARVKRPKLSHQGSADDTPTQPTNPTPENETWPNNDCDNETRGEPVPTKPCQSALSSNQVSNDVLVSKGEVPEMSQLGFSQVLQMPVKTNEHARNGGDPSKSTSHAQCQNQPEITNLNDVPNKNSKFFNRSPVTNVKSRHLSLDFEPNLSHTKISGRNSAMGHSEVLKSEKSKSSLRYYLESLPVKKGRKVPPIQDLSKEFAPNLSRTSQCPGVGQRQLPGPLSIEAASPPPAKLPIPRLVNPHKKTPGNLIILPSVPIVQKSPRKKYKLIQPKVESPTDKDETDLNVQKMGKEGSAFVSPKFASKNIPKEKLESNRFPIMKSPRKSRCGRPNGPSRANGHPSPPVTENVGQLASIAENDSVPLPCPKRTRNEVSIGCLEKDALDDYLHGGGNSQEQEEELMQYFQQAAPETTSKPDKLSQLRLLLERNLTPHPSDTHSASLSLSAMSERSRLQTLLNSSNLVRLQGTGPTPSTRRRVSFETSVLDPPETPVPQSPNTRRRTFNFTPIAAGPHSPLGRISSKPSSANASPFVSPRNTPVPRSKQNPGQVPSQSSFVASPNNGAQNRPAGLYMLNVGSSTTPYPGNVLTQAPIMGQRTQNMASYSVQKSTSRPHSFNSASSLEQLLAKSLGEGGTADAFTSRQNAKLQRSQSVNSNSATLQYLLRTDKNEGNVEAKMFAMPANSGNLLRNSLNSFPRTSAVSISAPQSPLVHYHAKASPFDFKPAAGSSADLLDGMLNRDNFLAMENNILNLKSIDACGLVDEALHNGSVLLEATKEETPLGSAAMQHKSDSLSQEVSRFFPEDGNVPNFAQMQYRSQSVPLRRVDCLNFDFSGGDSMAPTPVPAEYEDFGADILMETGTAAQDGLNSENLSQIFNLLDAQDQDQAQLSLDLSEAKVRELAADEAKLEAEYRNTLAMGIPENEVCQGAGRYEEGRSYPNTPLPYTSTVEYVTDASLDTFPLNALNLRSVQARLRDNIYTRDELINLSLPLMSVDSVSQLEQEVDKL